MSSHMGDWLVQERLGAGGMGEVFLVQHARLRHRAALKRLHPDRTGTHDAFERETRAVALLDHPHVVAILDRGDDGGPWFVMELAEGSVALPADWDALARTLDEVLDALAATHGAGLLHLDVKPSNVLVRSDGSHALADFGIAHAGDSEVQTRGSPAYMAPEQFDGRPERLGPWTDLYAVGCMAYQLATGFPPFGHPTWAVAAEAHRADPIPVLHPRVEVPAGFADWVARLVAKRPADRFASAAHARAALRDLDLGERLVATPTAPTAAALTVTATVVGEAVPVADLVAVARPAAPVVSERWSEWRRPARRAGIGLIDLLPVPLVGRTPQQQALWDALTDAREAPTVRLLRGPAGSGRTRLGRWLVAHAVADAGATVLRIEGDPMQALWTWLGLPTDAGRARVQDAVALRTGAPAVVDATARDDAAAAWVAVVETLSADRLVVAWLDDTFASNDRAALFERLVQCRGNVLVLGTASMQETRWPTIDLGPLAEADVRALLADWVGLGAALVADVARRSEGDVALALAIVREGVRSGRLQPSDRGLADTGDGPLPFPELPVGALPSSTPALRRTAALGAAFPDAVWAHVVPDEDERAALASDLAARGLLYRSGEAWRWASPITRLGLLGEDVDALGAAADAWKGRDAWTCGQLLLASGRIAEALPELFRGAGDAIASGQMAAAARLNEEVRALLEARIPRSDPAWGEYWRTVAMVGPTHQGWAATRQANDNALALAAAHPDHPRWRDIRRFALGGNAWVANMQYLPREARRILARYEESVALKGLGYAGLADAWGWCHLRAGDPRASVEAFTRAIALAHEENVRRLTFVSDASLGVAMRHLGHPDAVAHLERSGAAMLDAGFISATADLHGALGDAERDRGRVEAARHHYDIAARAIAEGEARADAGSGLGPGLLYRAEGRLDDAVVVIQRCIDLLGDEGPSWEGMLALHLAATRVLRGDDAWDLVPDALAKLEQTGFVDRDVLVSARILARHRPEHPVAAFAAAQRTTLEAGGAVLEASC